MSFSAWPGYRAGHCWTSEPAPASFVDPSTSSPSNRLLWTRPLGILEAKFERATQQHGQSDTFVRLSLDLDVADGEDAALVRESLLCRLLLAWAALRAKHPLLAAFVRDAPAGTSEGIPHVKPREFCYLPPATNDEALQRASETFLVYSVEDAGSLDAVMDEAQQERILNGPRCLLSQDSCLARLVLLPCKEDTKKLGFFLVISHIVSDGLSVFRLVNELFALASSPESPSPPASASFTPLVAFLSGERTPPAPVSLSAGTASAWRIRLDDADVPTRLPLPSEEHYPPLPLPRSAHLCEPSAPTETPASTSSAPAPGAPALTLARQRWLWAISRVIILRRQDRFARTLFVPRAAYPDLPPQPRNRWPRMRFDRETSQKLLRFCKAHRVSPSMLLYSLISLAVSRVFARAHPAEPYHPIVLGFPFSARPYLQREESSASTTSSSCSDPASDMAIRITFGCIALPNLPLDPLNKEQSPHIRAAALRGARLAKAQFVRRLAPDPLSRTLFLVNAYALILDKLLKNTGHNPIPYNDPRTAVNASMIGDIDRILPTTFILPPLSPSSSSSSASPPTLRLHDLLIGTRLHRGEGMLLEAFTWDGLVTVCFGVDDEVMDPRVVDELMEGVRALGEVVAQGYEDA